MPVLIRYCLLALWPPFALSTWIVICVLNLLYYLQEFLSYLLEYQAGIVNSFRLLLYIQPSFLVLALPISFLIAVLIVCGRLSADRELTALESCGFPSWVLIWPMLLVSLAFSVLLVLFMDLSLPWGNVSYLQLQYQILNERTAILVREKTFIKDFEGYELYVGEKNDRTDVLKKVQVTVLDQNRNPYRIILASEGMMRPDKANHHVYLELTDGTMQQIGGKEGKPELAEYFQMKFHKCELDLSANRPPPGPMDFHSARNSSTIKELKTRINEEKAKHQDTKSDEVDLSKKFSIPFSALAFAFIGIPLGLLSRSGSILGPVFAVFLVAIYEGFIMVGEEAVPRGFLSPNVAMWLPNFVLMAAGLALIYLLNHKNHFWSSLLGRLPKGPKLTLPPPPTSSGVSPK